MPCNYYRQCAINHFPYTIMAGDTLYKIAQGFEVSVPEIQSANPGVNPYNLKIGQRICIPICPANSAVRIIQQGDTLYKIAQIYNVSISSILSANAVVNPNNLRVGQPLCIPLSCPAGYFTYTVRGGDTLSAIAGRYSITVQTIIAANPQITDPNMIYAGQKLCIPEAVDPIREQIRGMTMEEKIGQMVIVGLNGYSEDEDARTMINNFHVGGFILFGYNVQSTNQLLALINSLKTTNVRNKVPLFISVDEEGGRVSRMPAEFLNFPDNKSIGRINSGELSFRIGRVIAEGIKAFGYNMNYAPVLDINSNPQNPVIGDRSFGSNAAVVRRLGVQTMKGIQAGGVIPVVKHFPGHGDTSVDSHVGLPAVNHDLNRLWSFELVPFNDAIRNQADAVMVAHILMNKIDPENPASLSKTIITDILRKQMSFNGVVVTDDMTMGAIMKNYDIRSAAIKAVNAGVDIVLVCRGHDNEISVLNALKDAAANGSISGERIDESVYRILRLKRKYNLTDTTIESVDVNRINNNIRAVLDLYNKLK